MRYFREPAGLEATSGAAAERTSAFPAPAPPDTQPVAVPRWPGLDSTGSCSLCAAWGERGVVHEASPREYHRSEIGDGAYADECPLDPATGVAAPVDPESSGVTRADLAEVIAGRLQGISHTPSGWVILEGSVTNGQVMLKITTWGPASQLSTLQERRHPVDLGESLP